MGQPEDKVRRLQAAIGEEALNELHRKIEAEVAQVAPDLTLASAWIDHYLLIDFAFTAGAPYQANSVQFYSASSFLCYKLTDNTSILTLAPILACEYVHVTWDTATEESVHIYGLQPKP